MTDFISAIRFEESFAERLTTIYEITESKNTHQHLLVAVRDGDR